MNRIGTFEHVQRCLEWREIQDKLTKRLKNYKFPNELQRPSFDSEESEDEMGMFFKMDEDLELKPVPFKKEEVSPRSVMEMVTPPVESFVPVVEIDDSEVEKLFLATSFFSYKKPEPKLQVVQAPVVSPPRAELDPFFAPSPFVPVPVTRSLLGLLLDAHDENNRCVEAKPKTTQVSNKPKAQLDSFSDFSDIEFVMDGTAAHLDNSSFESSFEQMSHPIRIRHEHNEGSDSTASSPLNDVNWETVSSLENSLDSEYDEPMMFRLSTSS